MITNQRCVHWCYRPLNFLIADRLLERTWTLKLVAERRGLAEKTVRRFVSGDRALSERRFNELMDLLELTP